MFNHDRRNPRWNVSDPRISSCTTCGAVMDATASACPSCGTSTVTDRKGDADKSSIIGVEVAQGFVATLLFGMVPFGLLALVVGAMGSTGAGFILMYAGFGPFALVFGLGAAIIIVGLVIGGGRITKSHALGAVIFITSLAVFVAYSTNRAHFEIATRTRDLAQQESLKLDIVRYRCEIKRKDEPIIRVEKILFEIDIIRQIASMELIDTSYKYNISSLSISDQMYYLRGDSISAWINRKIGDINIRYGNGVDHAGVCVPYRP